MTGFCGIELEHPIINASGTFDAIAARRAFGDELIERFPFAAFVTKTVTIAPRQGNPPPRLWELPGGMMNSIGLPNKGWEGFLAHDLPELARLPVPLIVNVMGFSHDEVASLVETFGARDEVSALELNVSCPNVESGLIMGADPRETAALLHRVRPLTGKPLIVKLTPNASDVPAVARAAEESGASAVSLINTIRGMALDPETGSRGSAAPPAACPARRSEPWRSPRCTRWRLPSRSRWSGWGAFSAGATRSTCFAPERRSWRSGRRAFGTRRPALGLQASSPRSVPAREIPQTAEISSIVANRT